jgi:hypothetical protein
MQSLAARLQDILVEATLLIRLIILAATAALPLSAVAQETSPPAANAPLELSCDGRGVYQQKHSDDNGTIGQVTDDRDWYSREETGGRVRVRFSNGAGEIKLAATLPGGGDKWMPLAKLEMGENMIRARYRTGYVYWNNVSINRRSAEIEIEGLLKYAGTCKKAEPESQARQF